ncbi:MAG: hypothetical protein Q8847_02490, partial [Sweet potato little leaf phytoplasma]|nr:hypothetical protein [Sweet potato little leaf phytoplasma]
MKRYEESRCYLQVPLTLTMATGLSYFKIINILLRLKINFYYLFNVFNKTLTKSKTVQGDCEVTK